MQRGMLTITQAQITYLLQTLQQHPRMNQQTWGQLTAGQQAGTDPVEIETSEDDVEILLDSLPMPDANEDLLITQSRQMLSTALRELRFGKQGIAEQTS